MSLFSHPFYAFTANYTRREALCGLVVRPLSVRPLTPIARDAISSYLVDGFLIKLDTNIPDVSGNYWKDFRGQRLKVKVKCSALFRLRDIHHLQSSVRCPYGGAEAYRSMVWRRAWLVSSIINSFQTLCGCKNPWCIDWRLLLFLAWVDNRRVCIITSVLETRTVCCY